MTNRKWINPPAVYEVASPNAHKTNRITQIVQSILLLLSQQMTASACAKRQVEIWGPREQPVRCRTGCSLTLSAESALSKAVAAGQLLCDARPVLYARGIIRRALGTCRANPGVQLPCARGYVKP